VTYYTSTGILGSEDDDQTPAVADGEYKYWTATLRKAQRVAARDALVDQSTTTNGVADWPAPKVPTL
jgi:hypothetical protein